MRQLKRLGHPRERLAGSGLTLLLLVTIVGAAALYISHERTFYTWDYVAYKDGTAEILARYRESPAAPLHGVLHSLGWDYNALFTIPLVPSLLIFG